MQFSAIFFLVLFLLQSAEAQSLPVPPRPADALTGSAFANLIWSMDREQREEQIYSQIISGNIPEFIRELKGVTSTGTIGGASYSAVYYVIPDYLAVGSDSNYFLTPMTPLLAQRICDALNCILPTKKMVDQIYSAAPCKLKPQPIPPSPQMTTVPVFSQHNDSVRTQRNKHISQYPLGVLVGGTKKDVIISNYIYQNLKTNVPKPVVIYGWHQLNGQPIQPVYNGHGETYADYSHGIRLVLDSVVVNGVTKTFSQLLSDPLLCVLVSDEGIIQKPYYTLSGTITPAPKSFCVTWDSPTSLAISAIPSTGTTFKAFWGNDGLYFNDSTSEFSSSITLYDLPADSTFFFKLRAESSQGYSLFSEVLAAVTSSKEPEVLIVNGFDRGSSGNTYNFIRQHGSAFMNNGYPFSSATNDAVLQGLDALQNYTVVDYILGDESTADESFSDAEQELVKEFLRHGGKLFVSGAEIAWDLDYKGSASDKDFIHNFLKHRYVYDAPNNQAGVYYQAEPEAGNIFDGIGLISFDNGTQGTINVRYPDVITGINGGINCLKYLNVTNQYAGIYFEGIFSGGSIEGKVICIGFPFETIYPESKRNSFLEKVILFFNTPVSVSEEKIMNVNSFHLYQNYPNPFNPRTKIKYSVPNTDFINEVSARMIQLKVYDILGNVVAVLVNERKAPGNYEVEFDASNLSSGIYCYRMQSGGFTQTRKLLVVK